MAKIIIGCERSATVGREFQKAGHVVLTCDILPTEDESVPHVQGDIKELLAASATWDLGIFHPDCTKMAVCGNRHYAGTREREEAIAWTADLWELAVMRCDAVCMENPASVLFPHLRRLGATVQYVQPWQFGHPETKKTGLALHNLPPLEPTEDVYDYMMTLPPSKRHRIWYMSPGPDRGKDRSTFFPGIARAMAAQWTESHRRS